MKQIQIKKDNLKHTLFIIDYFFVNLPSHFTLLQLEVSSELPWQKSPPPEGTGLSQARVLFWEHSPYELHGPQFPFTNVLERVKNSGPMGEWK